ncbi:TolC family protein [Desulfovibrio inopinatus]|uniref:TolC family protein n=1 Tax=Desulfovibrio inopinatus TaxID=102109 RepID=UPI0003FDAC72|nr:TolC family protein [Desulfovibrio inopinatus]
MKKHGQQPSVFPNGARRVEKRHGRFALSIWCIMAALITVGAVCMLSPAVASDLSVDPANRYSAKNILKHLGDIDPNSPQAASRVDPSTMNESDTSKSEPETPKQLADDVLDSDAEVLADAKADMEAEVKADMEKQSKVKSTSSSEKKKNRFMANKSDPDEETSKVELVTDGKIRDRDPEADKTVRYSTIKQPADFNECVRVALTQSPLLVKSALEIETKRLDEQDAFFQFIPTFQVVTTYYFSQPALVDKNEEENRKPYSLTFSTLSYNPILNYFEVETRRAYTKLAMVEHMKVIEEALKALGNDFLQLAMLKEQLDLTKAKQNDALRNLEYYKTRQGLGHVSQLDVQIAETKLDLARNEEQKLKTANRVILDHLKYIIGVPFVQKLKLNLDNAADQVLENFDPLEVTDELIMRNSYDLREVKVKRDLQEKNIALSYVKFVPTFDFGIRSLDTLSDSSAYEDGAENQVYPFVTFTLPMDWLTKGRDVARQYKKLEQLDASAKSTEYELISTLQNSFTQLGTANSNLGYYETQLKLAQLNLERSRYMYDAGEYSFDQVYGQQDALNGAKANLLSAKLEREKALLNLRFLSGELRTRYVNESIREKL